MSDSIQDFDDGWLYAAAMRVWHEIQNDTKPREVVRIMRDELHLTGGNPDSPTGPDLAKSVTTAIRDAVRRGQLPPNALTGL